jgi:transposase
MQALARTQSRLPMRLDQSERLSPEYKSNRTASLLAALEVYDGQVRAQTIGRNDSDAFIRFLRRLLEAYPDVELYVIVDKGRSHAYKKTRAWVARQKRLHLAFTSTYSSWLNQIEIWFGILTRKVVRRGIFASRHELVAKIMSFIASYHQEARPFAWTYTGNPFTTQ